MTTRPRIGTRTGDIRLLARLSSLTRRRTFDQVRGFVVFVGCPRSGHSLLGSFLDAHPLAVIAHELDALDYVHRGWGRYELYERILRHDRDFGAAGRQWFGYDYRVPGQWQGRFLRLEVIGDKRGGLTTSRLGSDPGMLDRLEDLVRVPVHVLHVVRNPFDNIATMARRSGESLEQAAERYFSLCGVVTGLRARRRLLDVHHEDLVADVPGQLGRVCGVLGLESPGDYLAACARVAFKSARQTRAELSWSTDLIRRVRAGMAEHDYLDYPDEEGPIRV